MKITIKGIKTILSQNASKLLLALFTITANPIYAEDTDVQWNSDVSLMRAVLKGETGKVKQYINEGANVNKQLRQPKRTFSPYQSRYAPGPTPLMLASWHGYHEIVDLLVNENPDFNRVSSCNAGKPLTPYCDIPDYQNALMLAAAKEHCKIIGQLIQAGANPYVAARFNAVIFDCLNNLIDNGDYNYNRQSFNGESLLSMSLYQYQQNTADKLIKKGAKLDLQDDDGRTALMIASLVGDTRSVRLLLKAGANINISAKNGETAASIALKYRRIYCLEQLMLNGADLEIKNMYELKSLLSMTINTYANIGKNLKLIFGTDLPLSPEFGSAIMTGDIDSVKKLAFSYFGYWGSSCTADKECALTLAILTEQTEIFNYLCDIWDVPIYPSSAKNSLKAVLDWLCFLEPTNFSRYLKW